MNELQIFNNEEFGDIRTVTIDSEPWFVGKDVADALGYSDVNKAVAMHVENEDKKLNDKTSSSFGQRGATLINESGLYALILGSKLKSAKRFRRWVTKEVLPTIYRTGSYLPASLQDEALISLALIKAQGILDYQHHQIERMRPKEVFADAVAASHTSILIGDLAKILRQNGVDTGQKRLFAWMRENGYLIKRKGADWNMPTQKSMEMGLFEVKESTVNNPDGSVGIKKTTKVTGKGQQYFINKFLGKQNGSMQDSQKFYDVV